MKRLITSAATAATVLLSLSAQADILDARFSGNVLNQSGTTLAVNSAISGEFMFDILSGRFLSFTIGGQSVAAGYASSAGLTPDGYTALYQAQVSAVTTPGSVNSSFTVDLEGMQPWMATSAVALLGDAAWLAANLDTDFSRFGYYNANSDGTDIHSVSASLTNLNVSLVPEPGSLALLLAAGLAGVGLRWTRRQSA